MSYEFSLLARHFKKSPEPLRPKQIRAYQIYLANEEKLATGSIMVALSALRFFYGVTLKKDWSLKNVIPVPKKPQTLPVALSPEEVIQFPLACATVRFTQPTAPIAKPKKECLTTSRATSNSRGG